MVTIILPIYNGERYLTVALESVKAQTCEDFECLCIDDGSSDGSAEIVRMFEAEDSRFRLIQQPNAGVAAARNRGIKESKGEYIAFLDQDDAFAPELLERLLQDARETGCDVVEAEITEFNTEALPEARVSSTFDVNVSNSPFADFFSLGNGSCVRIAVWGKLYAKKALSDVRFPDGVFGADDYVFTARLYSKIDRYASTGERLYLYRMHAGNVTTQMPMKYIMGMLKSREMVWKELLAESNVPEKLLAKVSRRFCKEILSWAVKKTCRQHYAAKEMDILRKEVWRLKDDGVLVPRGIRDRLKTYLFCHGQDRALKALFPSLCRK
jgi:glycosyltransferase involved in cell wall biosynthesis